MENRESEFLRTAQIDVGDDGEWFVRLFGQVQRPLYRFIMTLLPQPADADEVFQETIIVLWRKREQYEQGTDFLAWSRVVARYEVFRYLRQNRHDKVGLNEMAMTKIAEVNEARAKTLDEEATRHEVLAGCIGKLGTEEREIIRQRYYQNQAVEMIAKKFGKAQSTIYSALTRARGQLADCMKRRLRSIEA